MHSLDTVMVYSNDASAGDMSVVEVVEVLENTLRQTAREAHADHLQSGQNGRSAADQRRVDEDPVFHFVHASARVKRCQLSGAAGGELDAARVWYGPQSRPVA